VRRQRHLAGATAATVGTWQRRMIQTAAGPVEEPSNSLGVRSAFEEVGRGARGRPVDEVRADLERALRARDAWFPAEELDRVARAMAQPWWPLRHPGQYLQQMRVARSHSSNGSPDEEDPILTRIEERLEETKWPPRRGFEVTGIGSRRTFDGWAYTVAIKPWSEQAAEKVRRLCAPTPVTVIADGAQGR
jgi:hypothetical protein